MNLTKTYKWLTYFLAIPTSIIALFALIGVLIAFANPQFLIPVFVLVCIVLYIISSYIFLNKVLIKQGNCRKVIKDLIKINAFASLFFSILNIIQFITILSTPSFVDATIAGILEQNQASFSTVITKAQMVTIFWVVTSILSIFSIALIAHIVMSFKLIKLHSESFLND